MKKRIFMLFITTFFSFNIGVFILNLKDFGFDWDVKLILEIHSAVSIYAFKCSILGIAVIWIDEKWYGNRNNDQNND